MEQHLIATGLFINCTFQLLLLSSSSLLTDAHYQFDCHFCVFLFSSFKLELRQFLFPFAGETACKSYTSTLTDCCSSIVPLIEKQSFSRRSSFFLLSLVFCRCRKSLSAVICANLHGQWSHALTHSQPQTDSGLLAD